MANYENPGSPPESSYMESPAIPGADNIPRPGVTHTRRQTVDPAVVEKVAQEVNKAGANLRILEERYSLMRNKSQVAEEGAIELQRSVSKDFKGLNDEITDLKHAIKEIADNLRLISSEMQNLTKKEDFKVLDRYLDFWQPMNFVTKDELERLIIEKKKQLDKESQAKDTLSSSNKI